MNDITKTPADELVGEIKGRPRFWLECPKCMTWNDPDALLGRQSKCHDFDCDATVTPESGNRIEDEEYKAIAQELDRRCAEMRISLWNGLFKSDNPETAGVDFDEDGEFEGIAHVFITTKPASELHALLGWLLMKGGQGV